MTRIAVLPLAAALLVSAAPIPAAAAKFFGPRYVREKFPQSRSEIKRVWAEGDQVILHVHAVRTPGARGSAIVGTGT